jgi:hypothetical protein
MRPIPCLHLRRGGTAGAPGRPSRGEADLPALAALVAASAAGDRWERPLSAEELRQEPAW